MTYSGLMARSAGSRVDSPAEEARNRGERTASVKVIVVRPVVGRTLAVLGRLEPIGAADVTFVVVVMGTASHQQQHHEESDRQPKDWMALVSLHDPRDTETGVTESSQAVLPAFGRGGA